MLELIVYAIMIFSIPVVCIKFAESKTAREIKTKDAGTEKSKVAFMDFCETNNEFVKSISFSYGMCVNVWVHIVFSDYEKGTYLIAGSEWMDNKQLAKVEIKVDQLKLTGKG